MPIYLNDKSTEIEKIEKGAAAKYSKEMTWKMPNSAYEYSVENQKIMGRNSQSILCCVPFVTRDKNGDITGTATLRYAEHTVPNPANPNVLTYSPEYILIPTSKILVVNERMMEKNFFLANHPNNGSNPNRPPEYDIHFELVDKVGNAKRHMEVAMSEANAKAMILGNYQLSLSELLAVAHVYYHGDAALYQFWEAPELMDENVLRMHMHGLASRDPKKFMKFFATTQTNLRELLNKAINKKIVFFNQTERQWLLMNDNGTKSEILKVKESDEPAKAILDALEDKDEKGVRAAIHQRLSQMSAAV